MKHADVRIGHRYLTRVGSALREVIVLDERLHTSYGYRSYCPVRIARRFRVADAVTGRPLPKLRTAASLRPVPAEPLDYGTPYHGCGEGDPAYHDVRI